MALTYTELALDTFQRPNEIPLNPANWGYVPGVFWTGPLTLVNDTCECDPTSGYGFGTWIGTPIPSDQWMEVTLGETEGWVDATIRSDALGNCYYFEVGVNGYYGSTWALARFHANNLSSDLLASGGPYVPAPGDKIRLEAIGPQITAIIKGVIVAQVINSELPTGTIALGIGKYSIPSDTFATLFKGGSIALSAEGIPLPFSKRMTASSAVFNCLFIASPQGAQTFAFGNGVVLGALSLEYAQLVVEYQLLRHQDTANNRADLYAVIAQAVTTIGNLNTTIQAMTASGDAGVQLNLMQIVVRNALTSISTVQSDE